MVHYIKVRPYVARRLGVEEIRYRYADGNILIWDKELRMIDPAWVFHPEETVARIGGLMMDPYTNKIEQEKTAEECTPLPMPTDPAWAIPTEEMESEILEAALDTALEESEMEAPLDQLIEEAEQALEAAGEAREGGDI